VAKSYTVVELESLLDNGKLALEGKCRVAATVSAARLLEQSIFEGYTLTLTVRDGKALVGIYQPAAVAAPAARPEPVKTVVGSSGSVRKTYAPRVPVAMTHTAPGAAPVAVVAPVTVVKPSKQLTAREAQILEAYKAGNAKSLIARELGITPSTVHATIKSACRKLGIAADAVQRSNAPQA